MDNFTRIVYQGQAVLTYKQVALGLNCSVDLLKNLYRHHNLEFSAGLHFFNIAGGALRSLKKEVNNIYLESALSPKNRPFAKGAKSLKLWTKQGVARLSKLIDTPEAWQLFTALEQAYFDSKEVVRPVQQTLPLNEPAPAVVEKVCVYVLRLSSGTVKIGVTSDLSERIRTIERQSGFKVLRVYNSDFFDKDDAARLEKILHDKFDAQRLEGEFFNVSFEDACRALVLAASEVPAEVRALPEIHLVDKLVSIADKMEPCPERQRILIRAANLLDSHF